MPHVYSANDLCLYIGDEWNDTMIVADTLIPWTSEWRFFYETWHATGDRLGGGAHPDRRHTRQHRRDLQHDRKTRRPARLLAGIQQAYGPSADIDELTQSKPSMMSHVRTATDARTHPVTSLTGPKLANG